MLYNRTLKKRKHVVRKNKTDKIEFFYVRRSPLPQSVSIDGWLYRTSCIGIPLNGHEKGLSPGGTEESARVLSIVAWVICLSPVDSPLCKEFYAHR